MNLLTIKEAARILKVNEKTLRRWEAKNLITPIRTNGKHRRYSVEQIKEAKKNKGKKNIEALISNSNFTVNQNYQINTTTTEIDQVFAVVKEQSNTTPEVEYVVKSTTSTKKTSLSHAFVGYLIFILFSLGGYTTYKVKSDQSVKIPDFVAKIEEQAVLAATSFQNAEFGINLPTIFSSTLTINAGMTIGEDTFSDITGDGLTIVDGALTALNPLGEDITSPEIVDGTISEVDLLSSNTPSGTQYLTFNSTTGGFTWVNEPSDEVGTNYFTDTGDITYLTDTENDFALGGSSSPAPFYFDSGDRTINLTKSASGKWINFSDGTDEWGLYNRAGSPEGFITANTGTLAMDTANGTLYVKTDDGDATDWLNLATGASSPWDSAGGLVTLGVASNNVNVGGSSNLAKLAVDGDTDEIQLLVQGNGTQTSDLVVFENSAGTNLLSLSNSGGLTLGSTSTAFGTTFINSASQTASAVYTLPVDDGGGDNYVLTTNGSGVLAWEAISGAGGMLSFTLSGDSGSDQTITDSNTLEIAGGTNGIDTVGTATDALTINLDTTEIGTTTFGSGSPFTWSFDGGSTDPTITFNNNSIALNDGTLFDLSGILHDDSALQGFRLPQNTTLTSPVSGEGFLAYDTDDNQVKVFDGSSWANISGASTTLQQGYSADVDGGNATITLDATDGSLIVAPIAGTNFQIVQVTSAPTSDIASITNTGLGTVTNDVNGLEINFETGDGSSVTNSGLQIDLVSGGTAAGDIIYGINLTMDGADASTQTAINIGDNFDTGIAFGNVTREIILENGEAITGQTADTITFEDDDGTDYATLSATNLTVAGNIDALSGIDITGANLTVGGAQFSVNVTNGNITSAGDLAVNGGDITSTGDLTITPAGADVFFFDGTTFNIGGNGNDVAYNVIGDSTSGASVNVDSDDDLYVEGNLEVDGSLYAGGVNISTFVCPDCIDFDDMEDTLDLDSALVVNQDTSTWTQNFTGTTTTGLTYNANSLTTGSALNVTTSSNPGATGPVSPIAFNLTSVNSGTATTFNGVDIGFTSNPGIAGNTEILLQVQNEVTSNTTDNAVTGLIRIDNADTSSAGSTVATNGLLITNSGNIAGGIVNAINIDDTDITTDIVLQNDETISNDSDGTLLLTSPSTSLTGDLVVQGGDITLNTAGTIIPSGAGTITIGNSNLQSLTITTDGTGDGEVVLPAGAIGSSEILDSSIVEDDLSLTNGPTPGYILAYDAGGGFTWISNTGGTGASKWTDSGSLTYLTETTDSLTIGSSSELAKLAVDGDANEIQLLIQGNGTQTADLVVVENSAGTNFFAIEDLGGLSISPSSTDDVTITTDSDSTVVITGLNPGSGTALCLDGSNNMVTCSSGSSSATLQSAYDADANGSDTLITLSSNDDSIVVRNPTSSGTDSAFTFQIDNLATGVTTNNFKNLNVTEAGTFNTTAGSLTNYAGYITNTSTESAGSNTLTNVGLYVTATGGDTNYSGIFEAGNFGIGDTSPSALFTVGSSDAFQVNSSGNIVAIGGTDHSISNSTGNLVITPSGSGSTVLGSTNTTSGTTIQSGTGDITFASQDDFIFSPIDGSEIDITAVASTTIEGVIDLNVDTSVTGGFEITNLGLTVNNGASAGDDFTGNLITLIANDADADLFGLQINSTATANAGAGTYEALVRLDNAENTIGTVTDGLLITSSSGTDQDITDAIDVSHANIVNAINVGANVITGTTANIDLSNFDVTGSNGNIVTAGDLAINGGDISTSGDLTITPAGGDLFLSDGTTLNIGGNATDVAYNIIGDNNSGASASMTSDDDLYIEGFLEVDGGLILAPSSGTGAALCLDASNNVVTCTTGTGGIAGSGTAGQVAFFDTSTSISSESSGFGWDSTNNLFTIVGGTGNTTQTAQTISSTAQGLTSGGLLNANLVNTSATASFTGDILGVSSNRDNDTGSQTLTDSGNLVEFGRTTTTNNASATTNVTGAVLNITNTVTATSGTITDSANLISITQDADATGALLYLNSNRSSTGNALLIEQSSGGTDILQVQDNGNLTIGGDLAITGGNITTAFTADATVTVTGTLTANGTLDANGDITIADTNIAFDGASTTFTTTGAFTLTPGGSVLLGDGGDTLQINSSDWDVSTTGDFTGVGAITADGAISFTPGSTSDVTFGVDTDSLFTLDSTVANADNLVISPNNTGTGSTFTGTLTSANLTADRTWTLQDGDGTIAFLTDIPTSDNYQYWTIDGDDATTEQIGSTQTLLVAGGTNGIDTDVSATDTITINFDTTEVGTTTFGSGSAITWTFDASGGTDPSITFGNNSVTVDHALTVSGLVTLGDNGDTVAINSSDWDIDVTGAITGISLDANGSGNSLSNIDFDNIIASPTVDEATDVNLSTFALTIDLDSSGDFSIRDVTTDIATFADSGAITFDPTDGQNLTVNLGAGSSLAVIDSVAPTTDLVTIVSDAGTTTSATNALQIDFTVGNGASVTNSGLEINMTTNGTVAGDITNAINLTLTVANGSTQKGINFADNNYDLDINAVTDLTLGIGDTSEITLTGTNLSATTAEGNSLGSATLEWEQIFVGDDNGISLGLDQDWTLGYDEATDDRLELVTSGTSGVLIQSATATGTAFNLVDNAITTGTVLQTESTSTALTTAGDAFLGYFDWTPGSATTAIGDLFRINIGSNGNVTNVFNITDNGSSLFRVSETQIESAIPHLFSAAGDVNIAYDLVFTNQTASIIDSYGPLTLRAGESFESNNLTLTSYLSGNILLNTGATAGKVGIGASITPQGLLTVDASGSAPIGAAVAIFNQDESQDILTASQSGVTKFILKDIATNFGGLAETGAFVDLNSYLGQEFNFDNNTTALTADNATTIGDDNTWYFDTTDVSATYSTPADQANGFARLISTTTGTDTANLVGYGNTQNDLNANFLKANLPVMQAKIKISSNDSGNDVFFGLMDQATAVATNDTKPANGIYFWNNNAAGAWQGVVRSGGADVGTATCPGAISTTQFATARIEVLSATSVRFMIDNDASDGVKLLHCATVSGANPTAALGLSFYNVHTGTTALNYDIDYVRTWQDDTGIVNTNVSNPVPNEEEPENVLTREEIEELLRITEQNQQLLEESQNWNTNTATDSAEFSELITEDLFVTGIAALNSLSVTESVTLGNNLVINDGNIDTLTTPLNIQGSGAQNLNFMAGKVSIDTNGNMTINGDLKVLGTVDTQKLNVSEAVAGTTTIVAGTNEVTMLNDNIKEGSLIFVTPTSPTKNSIYVKSQAEGQAVIGFDPIIIDEVEVPTETDIKFNWWIVGVTQ